MTSKHKKIGSVSTCEMHTCGESVRIIEHVEPAIPFKQGSSLLERVEYLRDKADHVRQMVALEPRGHHDMFAALLVDPDEGVQADAAVIFMHNEGYITMCGHGVIALGRYLIDKGKVTPTEGAQEVPVNIQCPCGVVKAFVSIEYKEGQFKTGSVRFESVPAFSLYQDVQVTLSTADKEPKAVTFDIAYGGAFYAIVSETELGVSLKESSLSEIVEKATNLKKCILANPGIVIRHPAFLNSTVLNYISGVIVKDEGNGTVHQHLTIFADRQVDRSPCGSGVTAQIAASVAKDKTGTSLGQWGTYVNSKLGEKSQFQGRPIRKVNLSGTDAIIVEVKGKAFFCGQNQLSVEEGDPFCFGFKL